MGFYAVLCFFLWFLTFNGIPFFGGHVMLLCNHSITEMFVEEVENPKNLPIEFIDSARNDEAFVYYQFDFNAKQPLELVEIVIYNENESKTFQKFGQKNNVVLIDEEGKSVWIEGKGSILLRDTLQYQSVLKKESLIAKLITDEKIHVQYNFTQGDITVRYRFIDTQIHYGRMDYFVK